MILPLVLAAAAAAAPSGFSGTQWLAKSRREAEADMERGESGRRLLALTADLPVDDERLPDGVLVRYLRAPKARLAIDAKQAAAATFLAFELSLVRERARAAADQPVLLIEDEQAAYQQEIEFLLEKASASPEFQRSLKDAYAAADAEGKARKETARWAKENGQEPGPENDAVTPHDALARAGMYVYLFSESPEELYWTVERDFTRRPPFVRLSELADLLAAHGADLKAAVCPLAGRYCRLSGDAYPPYLIEAARAVQAAGGLVRVRESLGQFQAKGARELTSKVNKWVRER